MVSEQKKGWFFFGLFTFFIFAGIAVKRIWHHPEFMMMFHVPAAVFLAIAGWKIPVKLRERYKESIAKLKDFGVTGT